MSSSITTPDRRTVLTWAASGLALAAASRSGAAPQTSELMGLEARALVKLIRTRQVSCVEAMQACLRQIDASNGKFNAVVSMGEPEELLRAARAKDTELASGAAVGPLFGLPHAVKDLAPLKGFRFTVGGSPLFRDRIATQDNLPTERLRAAGVIFIGKTNAPEFGLGSHTYNRVFGPTHNAYDPSRSAGGSSGGAAVALALRMLPLADGSDYGGSLRNPAGWNNVCGFRTSFGRVPLDGADAWLPSMGVAGPMARTVSDLAMLLSVQAGYDPRAPLSMESSGVRFAGSLKADLRGKRVGWLGDFGGTVTSEPEVLAVCRASLGRFEAIGCKVGEALPAFDIERAWQAFMTLRAWQSAAPLAELARDPAKRAQLNPQALFELNLASRLSASDIQAASAVRTGWSAAFRRLFEQFDVLVAPTAQLFPFDIAQPWPTEIAGKQMRTYHEWMKGVCLVTLAGTPSLAVPAGFSHTGLPIGLQIIAPNHEEMTSLQFGAAYEAAEPLWRMRPPSLRAN